MTRNCNYCGKEFIRWHNRKYCCNWCRLQRNNEVRRLEDGYVARRLKNPRKKKRRKRYVRK